MGKQAASRSAGAAPQPQRRLVKLVGDLLKNAAQRPDEVDPDTFLLGRYVGEAHLAGSAEVSEVADGILELLGKDGRAHGFQGSWEILSFCLDRLQDIQQDDPDYDPEAARTTIASRLMAPLRRFAFAITYPTVSSFTFEWDIGGPNALRVAVAARSDKPPLLKVLGAVDAATREGAMHAAERTIDSVLGATRTMGFSRFFESRHPAAKRPGIALKALAPERPQDDFPAPAAAVYADRLSSVMFSVPEDLSELEKSVLNSGDCTAALSRHVRVLTNLLAGSGARARELRNACRLSINAEHSSEFGVLVTLAFSSLEGLLLQPHVRDDVLARLAEAVAHSLGGTVDEKNVLRKTVKKLYDVRSQFVHTGAVAEPAGAREAVMGLVYRVLRREAEVWA
jgi:hypothetical protein